MSEITKALIAARKAVHATVFKAGKNSAQGYKFVGHKHVVEQVREALLNAGLVVEQTRVEFLGAESYTTKSGTNTAWRWRGVHKLVHEGGEEREYVYEATTGPNDKAGFVASTALDRTALLRIMQLAGSDEENPEHDTNEQHGHKAPPARKTLDDVAGYDRETGEVTQQTGTPISARVDPDGLDEFGLPVPKSPCPKVMRDGPNKGKLWTALNRPVIELMYKDRDQMTSIQREWAEYLLTRHGARKQAEQAAKAAEGDST